MLVRELDIAFHISIFAAVMLFAQELRLIPNVGDPASGENAGRGGQWTNDTLKWPRVIIFVVSSPVHSQQEQQVSEVDDDNDEQHMSFVCLFNAPALGQSVKASTKFSSNKPDGTAMLVLLDPHRSAPFPDCKAQEFKCRQCTSCAFKGEAQL